jgi:hypothetical protein
MRTSAFAKSLDGSASAKPELPLIHTTKSRRLAAIAESGILSPQPCPIFEEPILYLFYGRPSYRDTNSLPQKDISFCPVCFIFRPETVSKSLARIYPFDTGASNKEMYKPEISSDEALQKYVLPPTILSAQQVIEKFFDTNQQYILVNPKESIAFALDDETSKKYYQLITSGGTDECDDRKSAIECQSVTAVNLKTDLMAVIMPLPFLDDDRIRTVLLQDWRAHPLTYVTYNGIRPSEYHVKVRECLRVYLKNWGMI